jgi:hypothetical protein
MEYFDPINTRLDQILNKLSTIITILEKQNSKAITTSSGYDTSYRVASNYKLSTATYVDPTTINNDNSIATTMSHYPVYPNDRL